MAPSRFMILWRRKQRRDRELRFREQMLANRWAWSQFSGIEDLAEPHAKRFIFEPEDKWAKWRTKWGDLL